MESLPNKAAAVDGKSSTEQALLAVIQASEKFMRTYFCFALTLLACGIAAPSLPATAQLLDATLPMQYIPLEIPCRAVNIRTNNTTITAGTFRNFSPGSGGCNIPTPASGLIAYAMTITVVPHGQLNYLTVWPAGELPAFGLNVELRTGMGKSERRDCHRGHQWTNKRLCH